MRYCTNCGYVLKDNASFCSRCGKAQTKATFTETYNNGINEGEKGEEVNKGKTLADVEKQDKNESFISHERQNTLHKPWNGERLQSENNTNISPTHTQKSLPLKKTMLVCIVIISFIASYFIYINFSESYEIDKYKESNNITALSRIAGYDASYSKRKKAIEALITINQPEAMQAVENLVCVKQPPEIEKMLFETLTKFKIELPSGIEVLAKSKVSDTKLIKEYFFAIETSDQILKNLKELICKLTSEEKGYINITNVLHNGTEIISLTSELDQKMFNEISKQNESWQKEVEEREKLENKLDILEKEVSSSEMIIDNNLEKMQELVMAGYYQKNNIADKYFYADESTKRIINQVMQTINQTSIAAVDYTANGDVKKKAQIYIEISRGMGENISREVSPLGLQVISEADKFDNQKKEIKKIKIALNEMSTKYSVKFEIVNTVLNNERFEQNMKISNYIPLKILEKTYNDETSSIIYPQVQIDTNHDAKEIINLRIQNMVNKYIDLGKKIPKYYIGSGKGYIKTKYKIHLNDGKFLSLTFDDYTYFGGAHERITRTGLTFEVTTGKLIEWTDLFLPISETQRQLSNQLMAKQADAKKLNTFSPFSGLKKGATVPSAFCLSENVNPVIIFQPYEVGPFSSGIIEFEIDRSCFENI